ncbi:glycosyltransferase [Altericista sp. CCNU0014]|uniref:glycosyltransferase n=1 Tax=Altericista sp. CCNU0014 TaxID=3082949 RepID=UPI00384A590A
MRILHVIPSIAQVRGGPSQAVLEMVKALNDSGMEAEIATTNDNGSVLLDVPIGQCSEYQHVPVWFFSRFSPNIHSVREFAFSSQLTTWLWQNIDRYDLLHIHAIFSYPSTMAMAIARQQNVPYIARPLGQLCEWSLQQSARKKQLYLDAIERVNLNGAKALHFTAQQEQTEVKSLCLKPSSFILPHGLGMPSPCLDARQILRQQLNLPPDEPIILFLSRLHPKKGLDILIPALGKLLRHRFTFVLAGDGDSAYTAYLRTLLETHGLDERTHWMGFVKGEQKNQLLQGADLFALTSHSENFGIAVLEALAAGLPALVAPGVALAPMIRQYQLGYVADLDEGAIAQTLEQYFARPVEAKAMGDRARQFVLERYTWDRIAAQLIEVYTAILSKQPIPH